MGEEKPVTVENFTKKFGRETTEREKEVIGWNSVTFGKENT